jgi:hypothetical protein
MRERGGGKKTAGANDGTRPWWYKPTADERTLEDDKRHKLQTLQHTRTRARRRRKRRDVHDQTETDVVGTSTGARGEQEQTNDTRFMRTEHTRNECGRQQEMNRRDQGETGTEDGWQAVIYLSSRKHRGTLEDSDLET